MNNLSRESLRKVRWLIGVFIFGLIISGLTAFPLLHEIDLLATFLGVGDQSSSAESNGIVWWILRVREGLRRTYAADPFMAYGTDWLAFGHLVIAMFFVGPWLDPVRNRWVLKLGLVACAGVIPLAMICGAVRGIPIYWRLIDCSFGILGAVPLWLALKLTPRPEPAADPR